MSERNEAAAPLPAAEAPFDAVGMARGLLRRARAGALATLDRADGAPFASLVTVATALDGTPILLLSRLSAHTLNLEADPRASLLVSPGGRGDPLAHPRLTVSGRAERTEAPEAGARFLARHPKAELYAGFPDFGFFRLAVTSAHLNGGFAKAATLAPGELLLDLAGAEALAGSEAGAVAHMNADHADALALYAIRLAGEEPGPWRTSGVDPEGIDLVAGERTARVTFPERVTDGGSLRRVLVALAAEARARTG
jgi:heme iron utilization protein